jgi:hypothetical protein
MSGAHTNILLRADDLEGTNIVKIGGTGGQYPMDYQFIPINKGDVLSFFNCYPAYHQGKNFTQERLKEIWNGKITGVGNVPYEIAGLKDAMFFPCKQKFDSNSFFVPDWENVKIYWNPSGTTVDTSTICEYTKADAVKQYGGTEEVAWEKALKVKRHIDVDTANNVYLPASGWISPDDGWVCVIGAGYRGWYSSTNK